MDDDKIQQMIEAALAKALPAAMTTMLAASKPPAATPAEPEPELDDPNVAKFVAQKLDKLNRDFMAQLDAMKTQAAPTQGQDPFARLLPSLVPGLNTVSPEFNAQPIAPGIPMTWADVRAKAESTADIDGLKAYVAAFTTHQSNVAGALEPAHTPSRQTPTTQPTQPPTVNRDLDMAAVLNGRLTRDAFNAKYGVTQ